MGRKQGNKGGGYPGLGEHEEKQQAVVLADTFSENFEPVSSDLPIALYPLVTAPMIGYVLELLASNGVEEVFIFCGESSELSFPLVLNVCMSIFLAEARNKAEVFGLGFGYHSNLS